MSETTEQIAFVKWIRKFHPNVLIFHIRNGGQMSGAMGGKLRMMGVVSGVHDLYVMEYKLFIEMKDVKPKGKVMTPKQKWFRERYRDSEYSFLLCYGFKDAKEQFTKFVEDVGK